jgi:hypothetical protein
MSGPLPAAYRPRPAPNGQVLLCADACRQVERDMRGLTGKPGDRVAGNTPLLALHVAPTFVQTVLGCPAAQLSQRVGRLKSRTAALLSSNRELGVGGAQTWSKGFWWARLPSDAARHALVSFIQERRSWLFRSTFHEHLHERDAGDADGVERQVVPDEGRSKQPPHGSEMRVARRDARELE